MNETSSTLMDAAAVTATVTSLAERIAAASLLDEQGALAIPRASLAVVGVHTGGAHLARRLAQALSTTLGQPVPLGLLDITLYRDDMLVGGRAAPELRSTDIPFDVAGRDILLVDDVLFTGRTVRAALDALLDLGRPRRVQLCVLVDRGLRELPVAANFVGHSCATTPTDRVQVMFVEAGAAADAVVLLTGGHR